MQHTHSTKLKSDIIYSVTYYNVSRTRLLVKTPNKRVSECAETLQCSAHAGSKACAQMRTFAVCHERGRGEAEKEGKGVGGCTWYMYNMCMLCSADRPKH